MTVKEFCEKYKISLQAVYAKIKRKSEQLDGHILKSGGQLVLDDFAEKILLPRPPDNFLVEKNNSLQKELAETKNLLQNLRQENSFQTEMIKNLRGQLDEKITQAENLQRQLNNEKARAKILHSFRRACICLQMKIQRFRER